MTTTVSPEPGDGDAEDKLRLAAIGEVLAFYAWESTASLPITINIQQEENDAPS